MTWSSDSFSNEKPDAVACVYTPSAGWVDPGGSQVSAGQPAQVNW